MRIDIEKEYKESSEIIKSIKNIAPSNGGKNLEDNAPPKPLKIEHEKQKLNDNINTINTK